MTRNRIILAALAALAIAVAWYFGSPRWTVWQMAKAAEARDSDRLAGYIDFPKLRESAKAQLKAQMREQAQASGGFGAVRAMIGMAMVDPVVDSALTAKTMRAAFARAPEPKAKPARPKGAEAGARGTKVSASKPGGGGGEKGPFGIDASDVEIVHKGLNEFRLRKKGAQGEDGDLIFRRHGLGWKLEEVRIPEDLMKGTARLSLAPNVYRLAKTRVSVGTASSRAP